MKGWGWGVNSVGYAECTVFANVTFHRRTHKNGERNERIKQV